jgi:hypothetical protein
MIFNDLGQDRKIITIQINFSEENVKLASTSGLFRPKWRVFGMEAVSKVTPTKGGGFPHPDPAPARGQGDGIYMNKGFVGRAPSQNGIPLRNQRGHSNIVRGMTPVTFIFKGFHV